MCRRWTGLSALSNGSEPPGIDTVTSMATETLAKIPLVNYLHLEPSPHLVASECTGCGARYFDRRNACAGCFKTDFRSVEVANEGIVKAFTIVTFAAPGVPVPYVAAIMDCGGTSVRANLVNVATDPEHVTLGMKVRLAITSMGKDDKGVEGIGFGYEPA